MAFVSQYEHDIFISYAHVDDELLPGADLGWVTTLEKGLRTRLAQQLGRDDAFSLWMDPHLARHQAVTPQILKTLRSTAVLVVILSPGYVASEWCRREKDTFLKLLSDRARAGSRVFVVERDRVEQSERPPELTELIGYRFWVAAEREGHAPRILGVPKPNPNDERYYDKLTDLSYDLANELRALKASSEMPAIRAEIADNRPKVFLAQVTDDLDSLREEVSRYLDQAGVRVLPETFYSLEPGAFREAVGRDLEQCEMFVQLLSEVPGKRPAALPQGYAALQLEQAQAAGKRILQWRRPELDPGTVADSAQRALLEHETVLAVGIEELKRRAKESAFYRPPAAPEQRLNAFVFVNMESADRDLAQAVCELLDGHGIDYVLPSWTGDPTEVRTDLEQNLMDCDGMIVIYGSTTVTWVREQLRQCRKTLAMRDRPLHALAVYEGPPGEKEPLNLKLHNMQTLNCRNCLSQSALESFLTRLRSEAAR